MTSTSELWPLTYLHQEADHTEAGRTVHIQYILHHTLGPLKAVLTKRSPTVKGHHCAKVVQPIWPLCTDLNKQHQKNVINKQMEEREV